MGEYVANHGSIVTYPPHHVGHVTSVLADDFFFKTGLRYDAESTDRRRAA